MRRIALPIVILAALTPACSSSGAVGVGAVKDVVPPPRLVPCAAGDRTAAVKVRRPSHQQVSASNWAHVHSQHRVATVVLRNVSGRRCYGPAAFSFTIRDRLGRMVGQWNDTSWFAGYYPSGGYRTFSLPSVYRCNRAGPFTAVAVVGGFTARRRGLRRSDITCLHMEGKQRQR
jgi:hypothetical protein